MLLGNAHIKATVRKFFCEEVEPRPGRHRRGERANLVVLSRFLAQGLGEDFGIGGGTGLGFGLRAGCNIELDDPVIFVG
jgi:hypothetical protein